jgi:hypothetical protein
MSKCYVDFGLGVVDKRSDGGEKQGDEWDIQGMHLSPSRFLNTQASA